MSIAARVPTSKMSWGLLVIPTCAKELTALVRPFLARRRANPLPCQAGMRGWEVSVVDFLFRSSDEGVFQFRDICTLKKSDISGKMEFSTFHGKATSVKIRSWFFAVNRLDDNRISWFSCRVTAAGCLPLECTSPLNTTAALGYVVYLSCSDVPHDPSTEHDFPYVTTINGGYIHLYTSIYPILRPTQIGCIYSHIVVYMDPMVSCDSPFISHEIPNFHG